MLPGSLHVLHYLLLAEQIFMFVVLISMALTLGSWSNVRKFTVKHYYVPEKLMYNVISKSVFMFLSFLILLSVMMPMAMFIM